MTTASVRHPARRAHVRQHVAKAARWLHIYLSMASFAVVLFFAATGLTVNHPDWFSHHVRTRQSQGTLRPDMLRSLGSQDAQTSALARELRAREHLHGAVDQVSVDPDEESFSYRAPGYSADVIVDRVHSTYTVTEVRNGFVAVLNDLHKGRDAGRVWGWVIDASAILLTLVSLTGLLILWFVYKRRTSGLILAGLGALACLVAYAAFVP